MFVKSVSRSVLARVLSFKTIVTTQGSGLPESLLYHMKCENTNSCGIVRQAPGIEPEPAILEIAALPLRHAAKLVNQCWGEDLLISVSPTRLS